MKPLLMILSMAMVSCLEPGPVKPKKRTGKIEKIPFISLSPEEGWAIENTYLWWDSEEEIFLSQSSGRSFAIDLQNQSLGLEHRIDPEYQLSQSFYFGSSGWVTFDDSYFQFLNKEDQLLSRFQIPNGKTTGSILGITPQMLAVEQDEVLRLLVTENNELSLYEEPSENFSLVGACLSDCKIWGVQEERVFIKKDLQGPWQGTELFLLGLEKENIRRMLLDLRELDDGRWITKQALLLSESLNLFQISGIPFGQEKSDPRPEPAPPTENDDETVVPTPPKEDSDQSWPKVLQLSQKVCLPCHGNDGYDNEEVWIANRDLLKSRIEKKVVREPCPPKIAASPRYSVMTSDLLF